VAHFYSVAHTLSQNIEAIGLPELNTVQ